MRLLALTVFVALLAPAAAWADPRKLGQWSEPFWEGGSEPYDPPSLETSRRFPVPAAATALPDGRVLYWNGLEGSENGDVYVLNDDLSTSLEHARVRLLDAGSAPPSWTTSLLERGTTDQAQNHELGPTHDLFCSDQKLLYDGSVLVAGGTNWLVADEAQDRDAIGLREARVFDPSSNRFRNVDDMTEGRWYPSLVTLADGRVAVASGVRRLFLTFEDPSPSFSQVRLTEIYDPRAETWADAGLSDWSFPLYPRLHLLPDGKVFYGAAGQSWNPLGETADQAMWAFQRVYDPHARRWTMLGHSRYGVRSGAASVLLRLEPPYDRADILMAGGTSGSAPGTWIASTLSEVVRWTAAGIRSVGELKSPLAGVTGDASQLRNRRWFGVPVLLPTGEVFLVNGGDADDVVDPGSAAGVRTPELYDPRTGTWRELATASRERIYHTSAVLLRDGRVLVGGHAPHPVHYTSHGAFPARSNNYKDATFEIYEPPYLFRGRRPGVAKLRLTHRGRALKLTLGRRTSAADISEVVLVRLGSNTHSMDGDIRAVKLEHSAAPKRRRRAALIAQLPMGGDGRLLPPGPYYVFAMRQTPDGLVPSIAKVVLIQPAGDGKVVARQWKRHTGAR